MPLHWSFGHLQPKLWAKEGSEVKLTIWPPTTKSQKSTSSQRPNWECNMKLERPQRWLQLWFRPCCNQTPQSGVMSSQSLETPTETVSGQFRDSNMEVLGKCVIWMQLLRGAAKNTTWGKVVVSLESGPWWVLWVKVPVACSNIQRCPQCEITPMWLVSGCRFKLEPLVPLWRTPKSGLNPLEGPTM
jgi:hypothetical protein